MTDVRERIAKLERFLKLDPDNAALLEDLATLYSEQGDYEKSTQLYENARKLVGNKSTILNALGALYLTQEQPDEAIKVLEVALEAHPDSVPLNFNLAYAEFFKGDAASARLHLSRAMELEPNNPDIHYYFALASEELEDGDAAKQGLVTDAQHRSAPFGSLDAVLI